MAAAAFGTAMALTAWVFLGTEHGRRWQSRRLLEEDAVRRHADPGLGRRQAADRRAMEMARMRVAGPLFVVVVVFLGPALVLGAWEDLDTAVPGAVLVRVAGLLLLAEH